MGLLTRFKGILKKGGAKTSSFFMEEVFLQSFET
jgi:hypothetical protein